ncbi:cysteine proteinase, partial [Rhizodiscina lignyota]
MQKHPLVLTQTASQKATSSYEEAAATCRAKVRAIVNECARLNIKYTDKNFYLPYLDALVSLDSLDDPPSSVKGLQGVGSVKRVEDIYEEPHFIVDGATADDVRQGYVGDCWFLAAITALSGKKDLIERICVDRDEKVGVYGFVFFRDGEWISEIVDDTLCLKRSDDQRHQYDILRLPKDFRESLRKGSNSLYFASCRESNETWLPLLEKAYAKVHGDYQAISGGFAGEGIEDLTGGASTYITSETVLDKDKLWSELMQVNKDSGFLFGCGSRVGRDNDPHDEEGFVRGHAYTVLSAREVKDPIDESKTLRLLKVRNPWGRQEWNGAWSDGSKEWNAKMIQELEHTFGDDGIFWISFQDWLKYFPDFERTRLFGPEWTVTQQWTSANVPWNTDYLDATFKFTLAKDGPVVLVLSQPDSRYFSGLQGRFRYSLHFRLYKEGEDTYIVRSMLQTGSGRSCSAELDLEQGEYFVRIKIEASRYDCSTAEEIIKKYRFQRRDKLLAVGKNFDLPHSKGRLRERENQNVVDRKTTTREEDKAELKRQRIYKKKERERERARQRRIDAETKRKEEIKKAAKKKEKEEAEAKKAAEK